MLLQLIIGRDANTSQLRISTTDGKKSQQVGSPNSVPMNVSRKHIELTVNDDMSCTIKNLNPANQTFVNGMSVSVKQIVIGDRVELGENRYQLDWNPISQMLPKTVDITHLKNVWEKYHHDKIEFQIAERKFNAMRSATGVITMLAIVCGFVWHDSPVYFVLYGLAIVITLGFTIAAYNKSASAPQKIDELDRHFKRNYICPSCGHFLGFQDYDILIQNPACPYCKTKFKK